MATKLSQSLNQSQQLVMTPQLQQAIKLLTLSHLEMTDVIAKEMVENPMLEEVSHGEGDYKLDKLENQSKEAKADDFKEEAMMSSGDDIDWQKYVDSYNSTTYEPNMATPSLSPDDMPNYENMVSKGASLAEHLEWQLRMEDLNDVEIDFAIEIIGNINDDGYLSCKFDELIETSNLEREECLGMLELVQRLDPVGCGAQDLVDCLLAQARIAEERSPLLEKLIRFHLTNLKNRDYKKITADTGVAEEQIIETAKLLHNFHPKPGRLVGGGETHYVTPDVYVVEIGGEFVVQVNDDGVPRLRISKMYQDMLNQAESLQNKEAKEFVEEKLKSALWLIKSINKRQRTIDQVAKSIVKKQQQFFKKGPKHLKPMVLKDVANELGVHESTVSRATSNKYMHTPIGMFELKYFFNAGIGGDKGGVDAVGEVVKLKIKELVDNENPKKPLSDQKIADLLSQEEMKVARRTVAKYRESLGILSSSKRKVK
ncbi:MULTISPECIES: RNA polymerase factor sigma-54 [Halobacteriovorax]|uniref:RNA polymerase sigma-54 factor n=1 Tax=Halobacteriovorax vibrionivorans TaxID=2152716 RepID=A0ABY0IHS2_9BACT|nr:MULTISPECIES: RNA polymerase factor sigma-54 [Halobacteriovorax]AYF45414.1 RNA polymerase sigma-54 factor [Halobacteriovorax sp. BALOs_7]RZF22496.1 RNA polymerase sigma-54 factor [Halobacteriovorax vibrionivorans]